VRRLRARRGAQLAALAVVVSLTAGACATHADVNPVAGSLATFDGPGPADDPAAAARAAVADVNDYWRRTYPETYGEEFPELSGGFHPYGPDTEMPPCGEPRPAYTDIADNAFYCPSDDLIAWDEAELIPWVNDNFGAFTIGIVFAHEFAHAVQVRVGATGRTIDLELQADCFAGAWTADVVAGNSTAFSIDEAGLDTSVAGMVAISDLPGTPEDDPLAHGSGFDRIGAFLDGYDGGPPTCAAYQGTERRTVEIPFDDADASSGNMALEDGPGAADEGLLTRVERDLNAFYDVLFRELGATFRPVDDLVLVDPEHDSVTCGGDQLSGDALSYAALYCVDENTVVVDGAGLVPALYGIGDFAVAAEIAQLWAQSAQLQLGVAEGRQQSLQADCLTGVWVLWTFPDNRPPSSSDLALSAGDLDEGIMGFLAYGQDVAGTMGSVFERTEALRDGFINGREACEEYAPLG
jgi:predicted metalloprotease